MNDQVLDMIAEAERQRDEVTALLRDLADDEFSRRPQPNRWSPGEQIAHVPLTDRPYFEEIGRSQKRARSAGLESQGPYRGGKLGNWFARMMEPPVKRRMRTPKKLEPPPELEREAVIADFAACRDEMIALLREGDGVDLDRTKITSPFLSILRMPVFSAYQVLLAHARRHIWLAKQTAGPPSNR